MKSNANLPLVALNIKDPDTDRLVRELAATTGESITTAVTIAARERLERLRGAVPTAQRLAAIRELARRGATLPTLDARPADEILGYDDNGLPA